MYSPTQVNNINPSLISPLARDDCHQSFQVTCSDLSAIVSLILQAFPKDVQHVREGVADFTRAAEGVVRRSLRQQLPSAQV